MAEKSKAELREGAASKKSGIDHVYDLSKWIGSILSDKDSSDITLVVEGEAIYAHKIILAASCDYFRALLQGGMMESDQEEVELKDVPARGFKAVLKYIYTAQLELKSMDVETILEVLSVADLYGLEKMRTSLCEYLKEIMSADNVLLICESLESLSLNHLHEVCVHFKDQVPQAVLESEAFCTSRASTLSRILSRDSFCADEIDIFRAVTRWCKKNPDPEDQAEVLGVLRLPLIPTKSLLTEVKSSSLITTDRLIEAIQMRECHSADLPHRGVLTQGQNLATKENGAKELIIVEDDSEVIAFPEANLRYHSEDMPEEDCSIDLPVEEAFTVALSKAFFVDYISFRLPDGRSASFGYHVEVSVDLMNWIRVFDQPEFVCRSLQRLHFKPRIVRSIRLLCYELPGQPIDYLSEFEASYTGQDWNSCKGYYAPAENVATVSLGAAVIECWRGNDEMIGGKSKDELAGTGRTEHIIGGRPIIVQLSQPYAVNSISMVLPQEDSHDFSYIVEVSSDRKKWTRVIHRSRDRCTSLQRLKFATVPVSFIKICGTASSGSKVFSCSEFKCWAEKDDAICKETEQSNGQPTEAKMGSPPLA
ncbi:BTB/POZ domain-containing protein 9-like [Galendromus occidentalis]|uniref:BTB/POZ domain-containing protein 9-like n=1 Tax=Galendromus occidentalis TaxID=34638 RepID=A0AAJ6QW44_9ACAR|nr:BTB/POZ domain-containing protein 9-like [Galendromus occidentalis]